LYTNFRGFQAKKLGIPRMVDTINMWWL